MIPAVAILATIYFTNPGGGQLTYRGIDPATGDSTTFVECSGGPAIHTLRTIYLCDTSRRVVTDWRDQVVDSLDVQGKEGLPDSITGVSPGNYYLIGRNDVGHSCASERTTIQGGPVTGAEGLDAGDPVVKEKLFDIHGRLVRGPRSNLATGIYFEKRWRRSGRVETHRIVKLK